jgi:hypothetical protein
MARLPDAQNAVHSSIPLARREASAVGRNQSGAPRCVHPLGPAPGQALPGPTALKRMMAAMIGVFCDSFDPVPRRILLDIDDTEAAVHGGKPVAVIPGLCP